jgi:Ras-related C3 botulinum toxin substrate 1
VLGDSLLANYMLFFGSWLLQNVKAVFDAAIKVVIKPAVKQKEKKKKQKPRSGCLSNILCGKN